MFICCARVSFQFGASRLGGTTNERCERASIRFSVVIQALTACEGNDSGVWANMFSKVIVRAATSHSWFSLPLSYNEKRRYSCGKECLILLVGVIFTQFPIYYWNFHLSFFLGHKNVFFYHV